MTRPSAASRHRELPDVTVLIPAFNCDAFIDATIRSVFDQDYSGQITVKVLDDGSTDKTVDRLKLWQQNDSRFQWSTQANMGRAVTRDRLLRSCATSVAAWIDSDDWATRTWLSDQVGCLVDDPALAAVSGQGFAVTAEDRPIGLLAKHPLTSTEISQRHQNGLANAFFQSCVVMRTEKAIAAGGYRDQYPAAEDYDLWLRLMRVGDLKNIDRIHLIYRVHDQSANSTLSADQRSQGFHIVNAARELEGLPELGQPPHETPTPKRDDWNRRIFWCVTAMKSGFHDTAWRLAAAAQRRHPLSLRLLLLCFINWFDAAFQRKTVLILDQGDQSSNYEPQQIGHLTSLTRRSVNLKRRLQSRPGKSSKAVTS
ncbi:MAG: glycosyltransferase family 2 protein [Planctomycetota bacterium]